MTKPTRLPKGTVIGQYEIKRYVSEGAFGRVYYAEHTSPHMQTHRALKELYNDDPSALKLFIQEAVLMEKIIHPNVPRIYEFMELDIPGHGKRQFLVIEWVPGGTLADAAYNRQVPEAELVSVLIAILDAADYLHRHNIIHRDIKPDNVQGDWANDEPPKLLDVGIAKVLDLSKQLPGTVAGTRGFAAPEAMLGKAVPQSDIYSIGATAFEVMSPMRNSFGAIRQRVERLEVLSQGHSTIVRELRGFAGYSDGLKQIVEKAMQPDFRDRYQTALEMRSELELLAGNRKAPTIGTRPQPKAATQAPTAPAAPPSNIAKTDVGTVSNQSGWSPLKSDPVDDVEY